MDLMFLISMNLETAISIKIIIFAQIRQLIVKIQYEYNKDTIID